MTTQYSEFFLGSNTKVAQLETLEISHPNLSKVYWIVRNARNGITATLEDDTEQDFEYYPLRITPTGQRDDLDQGFNIMIGDLGKTLPQEIDLISAANGFSTKPVVKYRTWRSDYLTVPLFGPIILQIRKLTTAREGASFQASAPQLNSSKTGELYTLDRFSMLRGLL
jgi:hypothetical protein